MRTTPLRVSHVCDRCGQTLEKGGLRFIAKVQVFAAYDPLEITFEDLARDHRRDIEQVLEQCEGLTEQELMRDVFVQHYYDLCPACQRAYLAAPLACGPPARKG
jgi:hypothetical protein